MLLFACLAGCSIYHHCGYTYEASGTGSGWGLTELIDWSPMRTSRWSLDWFPFLHVSLLTPPSQDKFYVAPANLSVYVPGSMLDWRQVRSSHQALDFASAKQTLQLAYTTTNTKGAPSHSVATLYEPLHMETSNDTVRMLVLTVWEDAVSLDCCPSWSLRIAGPNGQSVLLDTAVVINWALEKGYYVLVPDHEGPHSAFAAGWYEGAATLDATRAAMTWAHLGCNNTSIALWGYSGGGHAAAWAAQRHATYAPDVPIVAAAMGGVPVDLDALARKIDGGPFAGFVAAGLVGLMTEHNELQQWIDTNAMASLHTTIDWLRNGVCLLPQTSILAGRRFQDEFVVPDPLGKPIAKQVLERECISSPQGGESLASPMFPRYIWHAEHDEVVPFEPVKNWVEAQCRATGHIASGLNATPAGNIAFAVHPVGGHATAQVAGLAPSLEFLARAFEGRLGLDWRCGTNPTGSLDPEEHRQLASVSVGASPPWAPIQSR